MFSPIKTLRKLWRGEPCAPIRLAMGRTEAEAKLKQLLARSSVPSQPGLTGSLEKGRLTLFWDAFSYGNSYRPVFRGKISGNERQAVIEGRFTTFIFTQIFTGVWFGGIAVFAFVSSMIARNLINAATAVVMLLAGIGLVAFFQRLTRDETEKIVAALRSLP